MLALCLRGECKKFVSCEAALCPAVMVRAEPCPGGDPSEAGRLDPDYSTLLVSEGWWCKGVG